MSRRLPLWATLVPLLLGIAGWYAAWSGWRDRLETALLGLLPPGTSLEVGGFPYRLEARTGPVRLEARGAASEALLEAEAMVVNRQPWRVDRQVINLAQPRVVLAIPGLAGASVRLEAPTAQASLRLDAGRIARASAVFEEARMTPGLARLTVMARRFEAHLRETPARPAATAEPGDGVPLPVQAQLVLAGEALRFGEGDPVSLSAALDLVAAQPIRRVAAWTAGGRAELRELVIADGEGEVARLAGSFAPGADGRVRFAGTVETVCPASVRAALAAAPPVSEKRTRKPVRFAVSGVLGVRVEVEQPAPGRVAPPVRAQAPDCPRLR